LASGSLGPQQDVFLPYQFRTFPLLLPEVSHAQVATGKVFELAINGFSFVSGGFDEDIVDTQRRSESLIERDSVGRGDQMSLVTWSVYRLIVVNSISRNSI
jgi:hypothetical protein